MRAMFWAVGVIVALVAAVGAGRLWAEGKNEKPVPRTRIALINLNYIIKHYDKFSKYQEEMKKLSAPFEKREEKLRAQGWKLYKSRMESKVVPAKAEDADAKLKELQHELDVNREKAKKVLEEKIDEQMRIIYLDVTKAAQNYARAHDFDLLLHYNDAIDKSDFISTVNIKRKLQAGALIPMYSVPGMDISEEVASFLNLNYRLKTATR